MQYENERYFQKNSKSYISSLDDFNYQKESREYSKNLNQDSLLILQRIQSDLDHMADRLKYKKPLENFVSNEHRKPKETDFNESIYDRNNQMTPIRNKWQSKYESHS